MATSYRKHFNTKQTPQSQPVLDKPMVQNNAGGYTFEIDDWARLDRFLILGSEGGTCYVNENKLTVDNANAVKRCIDADGVRVVDRIVTISDEGRAPKNDPALFALAMCAGMGDLATRRAALNALPKVARIGTHLFHFAEFVEGFRGWGRGLRRAIAKWYNEMPVDKLAYQVVKYQQRDGWSHRDLLRLSHPKADNILKNNVYKYIVKGVIPEIETGMTIIGGFELAKQATTAKHIIGLIESYKLPREAIPTQWLNEPDVWAALLPSMPLKAMIRNLGKMTDVGLLKSMSAEVSTVIQKLTNKDYIKKSRLHPLSILVALKIYRMGHGMKGSLSWSPVGQIVDALDEAFYLAFDNVEPTNKRTMMALDVSGSMGVESIAGMPISPREASAAMALVTAKTELNYIVCGFSDKFIQLPITPHQRLDDVIRTISGLPFKGTDCALPMLAALESNVLVDTFIIYTDNETWYGRIHPFQALQNYRNKTGINAKLIVVAMTPTNFSIADPSDGGMLDIVGFDTATPQVINQFSK